jgi:hypothetical protein
MPPDDPDDGPDGPCAERARQGGGVITAETVAAALESGPRRLRFADWFSNGYFIVRGKEWAAMGTDQNPGIEASLARWKELATQPVLEAAEMRIPRRVSEHPCECECGHEHTTESVDDMGQAVFVGDGKKTVVQPAFADLLAGLAVFRDATEPNPAHAMLLGYDAGELVAAVMPMREALRDPKEVRR